MSKSKTLLYISGLFVFLVVTVFSLSGLGGRVLAVTPPPPTGSAPTCDPANDWWCKGVCDNSSKDRDGKIEHPLTYQQYQSCKCDGTPNLTADEVNSCVSCQDKVNQQDCLANNPITKRINQVIYLLSGLVAVIITGSIIVAGIQYSISGESANQIQAAKKRMINSAIALLLFILTFSLLQWLIPGGL